MRAICVLKMLLLVGLVADAGAAFAIEDVTQSDITQGQLPGLVQEQQFERQAHNRYFRYFDQRNSARDSAAANARHAKRPYAGEHIDLRLASLSANQVVNQVSSGDLFATDRSALFASPGSAAGRFTDPFAAPFTVNNAGGGADEGFTALEQQRNIILLQQRIAAARMHSAGDGWLMALIGLMLVAYQLCRKHRFLRPQPFTLQD